MNVRAKHSVGQPDLFNDEFMASGVVANDASSTTIESGVALGAPSSGDLGFAMAQNETRASVATGEPFNANPVGDATRAQDIEQMHTVQQAKSAGLFFGGR